MFLKIITTGGTIDKIYFDEKSAFQVGDPQINEVLSMANVTFEYEVLPLLRKDSLDLTEDDRDLIRDTVSQDPAERIIITHGTDTMVQTAQKLTAVKNKTMVMTGAMQPARFRVTDAVFNIACAVTAAQILPHGVYVAMNGEIFDPVKIRKNRDKSRFEII